MEKFDLTPVVDGIEVRLTNYGLVNYFTRGWCYELATYLHQRYDWDVWIITSLSRDEYLARNGRACHVVVSPSPGRFLDIQGLWDEDELLDCYGPGYGRCLWPLSMTGQAVVDHWEKFWQCREFGPNDLSRQVIPKLSPQLRSFGLLQ
jgi:hypothetical protein